MFSYQLSKAFDNVLENLIEPKKSLFYDDNCKNIEDDNKCDFMIVSRILNSLYNTGVSHGSDIVAINDTPNVIKSHRNSTADRLSNKSTNISVKSSNINNNNKSSDNSSVKRNNSLAYQEKYIGVRESIKKDTDKIRYFTAQITAFGQTITIGTTFTSELQAARGHDRAIIRTLGPTNCSVGLLNFDLNDYAEESFESFSCYDNIIRKGLFGTSWTGPKSCDFSTLILSENSSKTKSNDNSLKSKSNKRNKVR